MTKLTVLEVQVIKKLLNETRFSQTAIADIFDVVNQTISRINTGKTWASPVKRKCVECATFFMPKSSNDRRLYCSDKCRKEAQRRQQLQWKANNPKKCKENQLSLSKNRARDGHVEIENQYRDVPRPKIIRYCTWPGCDEITARNGVNHLWCQRHWDLMTDSCSDEYKDLLYNNGVFDEESVR